MRFLDEDFWASILVTARLARGLFPTIVYDAEGLGGTVARVVILPQSGHAAGFRFEWLTVNQISDAIKHRRLYFEVGHTTDDFLRGNIMVKIVDVVALVNRRVVTLAGHPLDEI
jgi:hypothetical protein